MSRDSPASRMDRARHAGVIPWADLLTGASVGILTGLLLGLSVSQVVGSVVGGLVALLGAFFGLRADGGGTASEGSSDGSGGTTLSRSRLCAFALTAVLGTVGGLVLRSHELLAPSIAERVQVWTAAGYKVDQARAFVAVERLGLVPEGTSVSEHSGGPDRLTAALFASEAASRCDDLSRTALPAGAERMRGFRTAGGKWAQVAAAVENANAETQTAVLDAAWRLACER